MVTEVSHVEYQSTLQDDKDNITTKKQTNTNLVLYLFSIKNNEQSTPWPRKKPEGELIGSKLFMGNQELHSIKKILRWLSCS